MKKPYFDDKLRAYCLYCRFFDADGGKICRRYPTAVSTSSADWCGEFQQKRGAPKSF